MLLCIAAHPYYRVRCVSEQNVLGPVAKSECIIEASTDCSLTDCLESAGGAGQVQGRARAGGRVDGKGSLVNLLPSYLMGAVLHTSVDHPRTDLT